MNPSFRVAEVGAVLLLVALTRVARWGRARPYRKWFRMSSSRDDSFVCRGVHRAIRVLVGPDGFELAAGVVPRGQTAFLVLDVTATPLGRWVDPFVEPERGQRRYRQFFERGVSGRRYVNLSPLFEDAGESDVRSIRLHGNFVRWKREATLLLFDPPAVDKADILVLAAHPDDAEIAAFGLYSGRRVSWVVTITAGEGGMADLSVVPRGPQATRWNADVRVWDSLTVPQLGGVPRERCINLVYPDNQLRRMYEQDPRPFRIACEDSLSRASLRSRNAASDYRFASSPCSWRALVDELRGLLEKTNPDIVVCPHPLVDAHHDHVFTTVAVEQAARESPRDNRSFFLYVVHRRGVPLYPVGPATGLVSPAPWTDEQWLADAIYSHPLAPDTRLAKYFAVEANHDMRTYSSGETRTPRDVFAVIKREVGALVGGTGLPAAGFLRRAPRPNEIYAVVSLESLSALVARALASRMSGSPGSSI
jgi:LmbE family N-acetylglucosaminyl deacetylase